MAIDRTLLAIERTLLAYLRSGVALLIAGITILNFSSTTWFWVFGLPANLLASRRWESACGASAGFSKAFILYEER